jgi:streptomycin 6-kinase
VHHLTIVDPWALPTLDDALRQRLVARYGVAVESWLDELPPILADLAARWHVEFDELIPRGNMSVVVRCIVDGERLGVLKVCPDRERLVHEAAALGRWRTDHVPAVLEVDEAAGALLMETIVPGTMVAEFSTYPTEAIAELLASLHADGVPDPTYPSFADRVTYLFDSWARHRRQHPELLEVVSQELFDRGLRLALELVDGSPDAVLLHGDLTPVNVLDGGEARGLVAIDPAPCLGDPAFDAVDLLFWDAADVTTIVERAERLAPTMGVPASRMVDWCVAFAGMIGSELAATPNVSDARIQTALSLATHRH